ncbi:Histone acetyltransferase [Coemansia guatemalensis]|uniref:Histone acetyltransferase n=1 Tax=Coemansia guatemalensis TaxID=2761395 RepID=A0A9W8LU66_9FUNG|nr:Histone acetyltransferase [Coemansia guatemalensis]
MTKGNASRGAEKTTPRVGRSQRGQETHNTDSSVRKRGRPPKSKAEDAETPKRIKTTAAKTVKATPKSATKRRKSTKSASSADLNAHVFFTNRLNAQDADTTQFLPTAEDRQSFGVARATVTLAESRATGVSDPFSTPSTPSAVASGVGYQVKKIHIGAYEINSWYISPFPDEYSRHPLLYICEFCLKYMKSEYTYRRHCLKCVQRHPPGDEIYRDGNISVFEVDGRKNKIYCQNLCLIGKMFLDTKTLYYDVEPFLFYILCEYDEEGYHFAGYYSKEKRSVQGYNLSCIMILPSKQREGYGKLLIEFSYLLSKKEGVPGSPEKPLSDFGLLSYLSYWRRAIYEILLAVSSKDSSSISIEAISKKTGMTVDDITSTLQTDGMLQRQSGLSNYVIVVDSKRTEDYMRRANEKNPRRIDPSKLRWTPFLTKNSAQPAFISGDQKQRHDQEEEQQQGDAVDEQSAGDISV